MEPPQVTSFDNEISLLYKWAVYLKKPSAYLVVFPADFLQNIKFESLGDYVKNNIDSPPLELYDYLLTLIQKVPTNDFMYMYYYYKNKVGVSSSIVLPQLNEFITYINTRDNLSIKTFTATDELKDKVKAWVERYTQLIQSDIQTLELITQIQEELSKYSPIPSSEVKLTKSALQSNLTFNGVEMTPEYGLEIFNHSVLSFQLPYLQLNLNGKRFYKIYKQEDLGPMLPIPSSEIIPKVYERILISRTVTPRDNSVYLTVSTSVKEEPLGSLPILNYTTAFLNLQDNIFKISFHQNENPQLVLNTITSAIKGLDFINVIRLRVSGEFTVYFNDPRGGIEDISFIDMMLNNTLINTYLFVNEAESAVANKQQLRIHYKSLLNTGSEKEGERRSALTATITEGITSEEITVTNGVVIPIGTPELNVKVIRATSEQVVNQFRNIFLRLLRYYLEFKIDIERIYEDFIPDYRDIKAIKIRKMRGDVKKYQELNAAAPNIFIKGYPTICQCKYQPIIINSSEVEAWRNKTFLDRGIPKRREVLEYPPVATATTPAKKLIFVCPEDKEPYVYLRPSTLDNRREFPFVPCCQGKEPTYNSEFSIWMQKTEGFKRGPPSKSKTSHLISTDKTLAYSRMGFLPKPIEDLLNKSRSPEIIKSADERFVRLGVNRSVNSLLHCLLYAVDSTEYIEANTDEQRENFVDQIRGYLLQMVAPQTYKQELYDLSNEQITERLSNGDLFFDPRLYYHGLEELFNVNIFVFVTPAFGSTSSADKTDGYLEIPRYKQFHSRPFRPDRGSILIYKYHGSDLLATAYPQCELIVEYSKDGGSTNKVFGGDITEFIYNIVKITNKSIAWEPLNEDNLIARENLFSEANFMGLTQNTATAQFIDSYGKCRGLIFPSEYGDVTMITIPSQPQNLPVSDHQTLIDVDNAVKIFGPPSSVDVQDELLKGLWYPVLDVEYGVYIPVNPTDNTFEVGIGLENPIFVSQKEDPIKRLHKLNNDINIILQIVRWLYALQASIVPMDFSNFAHEYFQIIPVEDSAAAYDFSNLSRNLPSVENVIEAIKYMHQLSPSFFSEDGKLNLYSQEFYEKLEGYLYEYQHVHEGTVIEIPKYLDRIFNDISDFDQQENVVMFLSEKDLRMWHSLLLKENYRGILIKESLNISYGSNIEGYLYKDMDGHVYLVQNVIDGDFNRALNVANQWYLNRINIGFKAPAITGDIPIYVIYGITADNHMVPILNESGGSEEFLQILNYVEDKYGALLMIL